MQKQFSSINSEAAAIFTQINISNAESLFIHHIFSQNNIEKLINEISIVELNTQAKKLINTVLLIKERNQALKNQQIAFEQFF